MLRRGRRALAAAHASTTRRTKGPCRLRRQMVGSGLECLEHAGLWYGSTTQHRAALLRRRRPEGSGGGVGDQRQQPIDSVHDGQSLRGIGLGRDRGGGLLDRARGASPASPEPGRGASDRPDSPVQTRRNEQGSPWS